VKTGGDQLEKQDLVDQIQKYSIGYENENSHQKIVMLKMMKIIGWKFGITCLWNM
jgi:hypothetical protein